MDNFKTMFCKNILPMGFYIFIILFSPTILLAGKIVSLSTDKCAYKTGEKITFTVRLEENSSSPKLLIKYFHLNNKIKEEEIILENDKNEIIWDWQAPTEDYKGYLIEVELYENSVLSNSANIAVDVSSDWKKFPRYGFVSEFPILSADSIKSVISSLNRFHMNGVQFYDWHYKHHQPLKGTVENPADSWNDIGNRKINLSTILSYINEVHSRGMKAMAYNLVYGAFSDCYSDGVKDEWGLYQDTNHSKRWGYDLPNTWASDLYFLDPGNEEWKSYIYKEEKKVFQAIPFDGWHSDQVGDPGIVYDYSGKQAFVNDRFGKFLTDAKTYLGVNIVFNAVNQYGQETTAQAPVDFLYTEVWEPNITFSDLIKILQDNNRFSNNKLQTVFAAYVNQGLSDSPNKANANAILLADAVIFSAGAAHIELGEHYLCHPYYPNKNLLMDNGLIKSLINYYDFSVAYENILRDGFEDVAVNIQGATQDFSGNMLSTKLSPGGIYYSVKQKEQKQVIHLINFLFATHSLWSDPKGSQENPTIQKNIKMKIPVDGKVKSIWFASPDTLMGSPLNLEFSVNNGIAEFTIPYIKYWDMIVVENDEGTSTIYPEKNNLKTNFKLGQNYPNPFNPSTIIPFESVGGKTTFRVFNIIGEEIMKRDFYALAGTNTIKFNGENYASGNYIYSLENAGEIKSKIMNLLK